MAEDARIFDLRTPARRTARARRTLPRLFSSLLVAVGVVAADQFTKALAVASLSPLLEQSASVVGNLVRLTYVENRGAAFGILQTGLALTVISLLQVWWPPASQLLATSVALHAMAVLLYIVHLWPRVRATFIRAAQDDTIAG